MLDLQTDLYSIGPSEKALPFTEDYKRGYLAGVTWGDGTFRYEAGTPLRDQPQPYWRVAMAASDEAPLLRIVSYLADFGVNAAVRPFDGGSNEFTSKTPKPLAKVEIRSVQGLEVISQTIREAPATLEYQRGFLAGIFDADGSYNMNLRIHQCRRQEHILPWLEKAASNLGLDFQIENTAVRLKGSLREHIRFFSVVQPALKRKTTDLIGHSMDCVRDPVVRLEKGPVREVVDIQTSTHTFFAAGLATHNCYAADVSTSPKKRNTTRLPMIP